MKKKFIIIFLICLMGITLSLNVTKTNSSENELRVWEIYDNNLIEKNWKNNNYLVSDVSLQIKANEGTDLFKPDIEITYPNLYINKENISNVDSENEYFEKIERINYMIYEYIINSRYLEHMSMISMRIDGTVTEANNKYMSILFTGYVAGVGHNNIRLGLTIDVEEEKIMSFNDFVSEEIDIEEAFKNGNIKVYTDVGFEVLYGDENLDRLIKNDLVEKGENFFIKGDNLVIISYAFQKTFFDMWVEME